MSPTFCTRFTPLCIPRLDNFAKYWTNVKIVNNFAKYSDRFSKLHECDQRYNSVDEPVVKKII